MARGLLKDNHKDAWSAGLFGMNSYLKPGGAPGATDKYLDIGIDASYQYLGDRKNIYALNTSYVHEKRDLDATDPGININVNRFDLSGSWHYDQTYGLTAGVFHLGNSANDGLYNTGEADFGSINGKPDSNG